MEIKINMESQQEKTKTKSKSAAKCKQKHEYSPKIAERRRALFPTSNNSIDDLNDMTPIAYTHSDGSISPEDSNIDNKQNESSKEQSSSSNTLIRTNLFPNIHNITIPASSFYKKSGKCDSPVVRHKRSSSEPPEPQRRRSTPSKPSGSRHRRARFGEINAGVKHKIRKPKKHEISKELLLKAAENIIDNSSLNEYLDDINITKEQREELDKNDAVLDEYMKNLNEYNIIPSTSIGSNAEHVDKQIKMIQPAIIPAVPNSDNCREATVQSKRPISPSLTENDTKRKFFKSSRAKPLTPNIQQTNALGTKLGSGSDNISRISLQAPLLDVDMSDLDCSQEEESAELAEKVYEILNDLEDKENIEQPIDNNILANIPSTSISCDALPVSEIPAELERNTNIPISLANDSLLMSPTTQMCDMTSDLAINSPKKVKNLTALLNGSIPVENSSSASHLFRSAIMKKFSSLSKDQMLLDAGQKRFGVTECAECKFVYHMGDPEDEILHLNYHSGSHALRFGGWKNERVVDRFEGSRILHIIPSDPKIWLKKMKDLLEIVNRDLGFFDFSFNIENSQIFLYVKDKMIIGCLVAEPQEQARKMLTDSSGVDLCSEDTYPIRCGVSRVWVLQAFRKKKIATLLMNSLRRNFCPGYILSDTEIAFSSPTDMGKKFATGYFGTANFLVYGV